MKKDLLGMTLQQMIIEMKELGLPAYRAKQIFRWLVSGVKDFEHMTNIPKNVRNQLRDSYQITAVEQVRRQVSSIDGTAKYLYKLDDGELIESVLMTYRHGSSACISTQVGCAMGCSFCASGQEGLVRNLTAAEMVDQILAMSADQQTRVSHVVLMGSGEPLQNLKDVVELIRILNEPEGLHISMRHITLSTCGLIPEINKLASLKLPINLAVSLHAATDDVRRRLMPVAYRYEIHDLIKACEHYSRLTHRRVTYEYALIKGVNDSKDDIRTLGELLQNQLCHVNLIPVNPVQGTSYRAGPKEQAYLLKEILDKMRIPATVRREMGSDIDAACGQLKRHTERPVNQ
jgi:23S rRNA (adenine2503-C2)-methyltransferase